VADAESGKVLVQQRANAAGTNDADLLGCEDVLAAVVEDAYLAVVPWIRLRWSGWRRVEDLGGATDDDSVVVSWVRFSAQFSAGLV